MSRRVPGAASQAFAVAGGLAAWGVAVLVAYPVVQVACALGRPVLVHLVRWVAMAVAVAATVVGVWIYRSADAADGDDVGGTRIQRVRFIGLTGTLLSASGLLLLFVEDLATWVIDPCL
ncbi:MAG TPA: hypothetical protein VK891_12820 [Euzebyales bacterium]|nr:hypothetical protein [Euzebyales bacterium]